MFSGKPTFLLCFSFVKMSFFKFGHQMAQVTCQKCPNLFLTPKMKFPRLFRGSGVILGVFWKTLIFPLFFLCKNEIFLVWPPDSHSDLPEVFKLVFDLKNEVSRLFRGPGDHFGCFLENLIFTHRVGPPHLEGVLPTFFFIPHPCHIQ